MKGFKLKDGFKGKASLKAPQHIAKLFGYDEVTVNTMVEELDEGEILKIFIENPKYPGEWLILEFDRCLT
jgi:hypothetical protein